MFKIGDFSKLTRVSIRMLRYYDEVGLFKPATIDSFTGYRYYSAKQIKILNLIVSLRDFGFNVADIAIVINEQSDEKQIEMLKERSKEVEQNIIAEQEKLKKINAAIKNLKRERVNMSYNVTLKSVPSFKAISLRDIIPTYYAEGMLWERLGKYMEKKKIPCTGFCYAEYYDEGAKEEEVDVEIFMSVEELLEDEEGFTFKETEHLEEVVSILVPGDYSNIAPAFNFLGKWIFYVRKLSPNTYKRSLERK